MKKQRKHYSPGEKVAILRRHLLEHEPISKLCDELGLQPTVFYRWQKEAIHTERDRKLEAARKQRQIDRQRLREERRGSVRWASRAPAVPVNV